MLGSQVRFHLSMLIFLVAVALSWLGWLGLLLAVALLAAVVLHEVGHALTRWSLGGEMEDVVIWPTGGLRVATLPNRPIETTLILFGGRH